MDYQQQNEQSYKALLWLVNLFHGVSKSGCTDISDAEWDAAIAFARDALATEERTQENAQLRDGLTWLNQLIHGVSMWEGNHISNDQWEAALELSKEALNRHKLAARRGEE